MAVQAIRLQNFLAFKNTGWIELKPICLLFGKNSSGKSAFIRALRLLKQSLQSSSDQPLNFVEEYGVDVGSFVEAVHKRDVTQPMIFEFRCDFVDTYDNLKRRTNFYAEQFGARGSISDQEKRKWVDLRLNFRYITRGKRKEVWLTELCITSPWIQSENNPDGSVVFSAERSDLSIEQIPDQRGPDAFRTTTGSNWQYWSELLRGSEYSEFDTELVLLEIDTMNGFLPKVSRVPTTKNLGEQFEKDLDLIVNLFRELNQSITEFLQTLSYLGPVRPEPQRVFAFDRLRFLQWRKQGWNTFLDYLQNLRHSTKIDSWFIQSKLGQSVKVSPPRGLGDGMFVASVTIEEIASFFDINMKDVGYGASQVLPILVQGVFAEPGSLVIVEQPELHLHPAAQAELGDWFVEMSKERVRFLLETHSENLLLRFRRRLAETSSKKLEERLRLTLEDFRTYFVDRKPEEGVSQVEELKFDSWGDYARRPLRFGDFFGQDFEELVQLKKARGKQNPGEAS